MFTDFKTCGFWDSFIQTLQTFMSHFGFHGTYLAYDKLLVLTFLYERTIRKAAWIFVRFLEPEREFAYSIKVACKTGLENFLWLCQYKYEYMLYIYVLPNIFFSIQIPR